MSAKLPSIEKVRAIDELKLQVKFRGRGLRTIRLAGLVALKKVLQPLKDYSVFAKVKVIDGGAAVAWPNGLDLGASTLWRISVEQAPFTNEDFVAWQERVGLSNQEAADALGCSLSTIKNIRGGSVPVGNAVAIACRAMDAELTTLAAHYRPLSAGRPRSKARKAA